MGLVGAAGRPVIVAGVDGSEPSREALRWAAGHAELTGAEVHALMAWQLPEIYAYTPRDYEGGLATPSTPLSSRRSVRTRGYR